MHFAKPRSSFVPIVAVATAFAATSAFVAVAVSSTSQADQISRTVRIGADHDGYASSTAPNEPRSDRNRLVARNTPEAHKVTFMRFTVTKDALGEGDVVGAKVLIVPQEEMTFPATLRLVPNNDWTDKPLTYNNSPDVGQPVGTINAGPPSTRWIDVSQTVKGPGTYSFAVTTERGRSLFFSSETFNAPQLLVRINSTPEEPKPSDTPKPDPDPTTTSPKPDPDPTTASPKPSDDSTGGTGSGACQEQFPGDPCAGTMYYGASVEGGDPRTLESEVGAPLALFRSYMQATTPASKFASRAAADVAAGRIPLISSKVPGTWAQAASGAQDTWLIDRIKALATVDGPVWLALHHEPRNDGDPADWVKMQQRARTLIDQYSTNIALVGILNGWDFLEKNGNPERWYHPVGTGVDIMGFDSYNPWSPTNGMSWKSPETTMSPGLAIQKWGYPTLVGETGVRTDPANPGKAAQWLADTYKFAVDHDFVGVSYFDSGANSPDGTWDLTGERLEQFKRNLNSATTARLAR